MGKVNVKKLKKLEKKMVLLMDQKWKIVALRGVSSQKMNWGLVSARRIRNAWAKDFAIFMGNLK